MSQPDLASQASVDGIALSSEWAAEIVDGGTAGVAVVDVATSHHGSRRVAATVVRDGQRRVYVDDQRPGLIFPKAWFDDGVLRVFGRVCPKPRLSDVEALDTDPAKGCGAAPLFVYRNLDLRTGIWTETASSVPMLRDHRQFVSATSGQRALVTGGGSDHSKPWLYLVDLVTGSMVDRGSNPAGPAGVGTVCSVPEGFLTASIPDLTDVSMMSDRPTKVSLLDADGVHALQGANGSGIPFACVPSGMAFLPGADGSTFHIARFEGGAIRWEALELPPELAGSHQRRAVADMSRNVVIWGDTRAGSFQAWRVVDGELERIGASIAGTDPPSKVTIVGDEVAVIGGTRDHPVTRVL